MPCLPYKYFEELAMDNVKKNSVNEGILIIAIGVGMLILALSVPSNPVVLKGWINIFAQAKLLPLIVSSVTIIFGIRLLLGTFNGKINAVSAGIESKKKAVILILTCVAYLVAIMYLGFLIPTALYLGFTILFLNQKLMSLPKMIALVVAYTAITIFVVPLIINIRLP